MYNTRTMLSTLAFLLTLGACTHPSPSPDPPLRPKLLEESVDFSRSLDELRALGAEETVVVVRILDPCDQKHQIVLSGNGGSAQIATIKEEKEVQLDTDELSAEVEVALTNLQDLTIPAILEGPLVIHGNHYEIWILAGMTESYFYFQGVPGDRNGPPLQKWVDDLVDLIPSLECASAKEAPTPSKEAVFEACDRGGGVSPPPRIHVSEGL